MDTSNLLKGVALRTSISTGQDLGSKCLRKRRTERAGLEVRKGQKIISEQYSLFHTWFAISKKYMRTGESQVTR